MTDITREAFEAAYAAINPIATTKETAWICYQAATLAERERCALVCEVPKHYTAFDIRCGEDGIELLNDMAATIRQGHE